jgi:hypothetical protein
LDSTQALRLIWIEASIRQSPALSNELEATVPTGFIGLKQIHLSLLAATVAIVPCVLLLGCSSPGNAPPSSSPPGVQKSYTTSFSLAEDPLSEGENWINGGTAGLDWANVQTVPGLAFGAQSGSHGYDDSTAILAGVWSPNQMVQATVHAVNQHSDPVFEEVELRLRTTITPHKITGYEVNFRCTSDGSQYIQIVRWDGPFGHFTYVSNTTGPGLHDGDIVKAVVSGSEITVYLNGTQVLQGSDGTFATGSPGIGFFLQGTTGVNRDFGFTNVTAANLATAN